MVSRVFDVIREADGVVLLSVDANTDFAGATVRFFDQWQDPVHLDRYAATFTEAAAWLRAQGIS